MRVAISPRTAWGSTVTMGEMTLGTITSMHVLFAFVRLDVVPATCSARVRTPPTVRVKWDDLEVWDVQSSAGDESR
jgi:hypothetical protein